MDTLSSPWSVVAASSQSDISTLLRILRSVCCPVLYRPSIISPWPYLVPSWLLSLHSLLGCSWADSSHTPGSWRSYVPPRTEHLLTHSRTSSMRRRSVLPRSQTKQSFRVLLLTSHCCRSTTIILRACLATTTLPPLRSLFIRSIYLRETERHTSISPSSRSIPLQPSLTLIHPLCWRWTSSREVAWRNCDFVFVLRWSKYDCLAWSTVVYQVSFILVHIETS